MGFEPLKVDQVNRGFEVDALLLFALAGQMRRQTEAGLFGRPIENAEDTDHLAGIAPQGAYPGITRQTIPLYVIWMGNVPQEGITDRCIGLVKDRIAHAQHLPLWQVRIAGCIRLQPLRDKREFFIANDGVADVFEYQVHLLGGQ